MRSSSQTTRQINHFFYESAKGCGKANTCKISVASNHKDFLLMYPAWLVYVISALGPGWVHSSVMTDVLFRCALLYCASQILGGVLFCFYALKVCGNPAWRKSTGAMFSNSACSLHVPCHIMAILSTFQMFS